MSDVVKLVLILFIGIALGWNIKQTPAVSLWGIICLVLLTLI